MTDITLLDETPTKAEFLADVVAGLGRSDKRLPCKYLYDERGSQLFEQICELDEYYLTRTELAIMREHAADMARCLAAGCLLVEYGSGSGLKTELLLDRMQAPAAYVPVDISKEHLQQTARRLAECYPQLPVHPVCADFTKPFALPLVDATIKRTAVYFPGSTIGNFGPSEAISLLAGIARLVGPGGALLIGVDLKKTREMLEEAYDDPEGVTGQFNLNLLAHINRELGADFQLDQFRHRAVYNEVESRVEMHLVSTAHQTVELDGDAFQFVPGETIHTESSYKYSPEQFQEIAAAAGFSVKQSWCDADRLFSVQLLSFERVRKPGCGRY